MRLVLSVVFSQQRSYLLNRSRAISTFNIGKLIMEMF